MQKKKKQKCLWRSERVKIIEKKIIIRNIDKNYDLVWPNEMEKTAAAAGTEYLN